MSNTMSLQRYRLQGSQCQGELGKSHWPLTNYATRLVKKQIHCYILHQINKNQSWIYQQYSLYDMLALKVLAKHM